MTHAAPSERPALVVYGAGGHGLVVAEAAEASGFRVLGFLDDAPQPQIDVHRPILRPDDPALDQAAFIVAIGDNETRQRVLNSLTRVGRRLTTVIHPTAMISPSAVIGEGTWVGPGAIVHGEVRIGYGAIINSGAIVEHHNGLGACVHIGPGVVMGGGVQVDDLALVGLGARVLPGVRIGARARVGAGAVVVRDVAADMTAAGVPARPTARSA